MLNDSYSYLPEGATKLKQLLPCFLTSSFIHALWFCDIARNFEWRRRGQRHRGVECRKNFVSEKVTSTFQRSFMRFWGKGTECYWYPLPDRLTDFSSDLDEFWNIGVWEKWWTCHRAWTLLGLIYLLGFLSKFAENEWVVFLFIREQICVLMLLKYTVYYEIALAVIMRKTLRKTKMLRLTRILVAIVINAPSGPKSENTQRFVYS